MSGSALARARETRQYQRLAPLPGRLVKESRYPGAARCRACPGFSSFHPFGVDAAAACCRESKLPPSFGEACFADDCQAVETVSKGRENRMFGRILQLRARYRLWLLGFALLWAGFESGMASFQAEPLFVEVSKSSGVVFRHE